MLLQCVIYIIVLFIFYISSIGDVLNVFIFFLFSDALTAILYNHVENNNPFKAIKTFKSFYKYDPGYFFCIFPPRHRQRRPQLPLKRLRQGVGGMPERQSQCGVNVETAVLALGHADTDTTADGQACAEQDRSASCPWDLGGGGGGQRWGRGAVARPLRPGVRGRRQRCQRRFLRLRVARLGTRPLRTWLWR